MPTSCHVEYMSIPAIKKEEASKNVLMDAHRHTGTQARAQIYSTFDPTLSWLAPDFLCPIHIGSYGNMRVQMSSSIYPK